jgi:hypothetical protein
MMMNALNKRDGFRAKAVNACSRQDTPWWWWWWWWWWYKHE